MSKLSNVIKGQAQISVLRLTSDGPVPIALEVPAGFTIENGIEETVSETRSATGERVRGNIFTAAVMPNLNLTVGSGKNNNFWHELLFGYRYVASEANVPFTETITVPFGSGPWVRPAATAGKRFGMVVDQAVQGAAYISSAVGFVAKSSVELTQVDYVAFVADPPSTLPGADEFMVGVNGAMIFPEELRGETVILTWEMPDVNVITLSETPTGFFRVIMEVLDDENTIEIFDFPRVKPNVSGKTYDPTAETWELAFYVTPAPGQCKPFEHYYTPLVVSCE